MPTQTFQPAVNGDDGMIRAPATWFQQYVGFGSYGGASQDIWLRFPSILLAQGATISSAVLRFRALRTDSTTVNVNIYAYDTANYTAPPTNYGTYPTTGYTDAVVAWAIESWTLDSTYDSPDIKTIIQELVDRGDWASGGAILILVRNNGSVSAERYAYDYNDSSADSAKLIITTSAIHTITATAGANGSISPSGSVSVTDGDDQTFTITSDATGSASTSFIKDVLVDSVSAGRVASYAFTNVTADHTIAASFLTWPDAEAITVITREIINETTPAHFTDAMILEWTNEAIRDIAIKTSCIEAIVAATTTSGSRLVPFAGHKVRYVEYLPDSGRRTGLQHITPKMLGRLPINAPDSVMPTTWNNADRSNEGPSGPEMLLSGGHLIATNTYLGITHPGSSFGFGGVRSLFGASSGKYYWEESTEFTSDILVGISKAAANYYCGVDINGWGYYSFTGNIVNDNSGSAYGNAYTTGSVIGNALDMDNGKYFLSIDGVWQNNGNPETGANPAVTGLSGTVYAHFSGYDVGDKVTTNFGDTPFIYTVPTGFNAGFGAIAAPNETRVPQYWCQWGSAIVIEPTPTAAYNLNLYISQWPDYLMSDLDDEPLIAEGFQALILAFVLFKTYLRDRKFKTAAFCYKMYVAGINEIKALRIKRMKDKATDIALPDMVLGRGQNDVARP